MPNRRPYPTDVSDEEWAFVAPYLALVRQDASQRTHDLRGLLRLASCREPEPTALAKDYERLPETVAGLHFVAFACLFLHRAIAALVSGP